MKPRMPITKESLLIALGIALVGFFSIHFYSPESGVISNVMRAVIVITADCPAPGTGNFDVNSLAIMTP